MHFSERITVVKWRVSVMQGRETCLRGMFIIQFWLYCNHTVVLQVAVCDVTQTGEVTPRPSPSRTKSITLVSHEFFFRRYHSQSVSLGSLIKARWKKRCQIYCQCSHVSPPLKMSALTRIRCQWKEFSEHSCSVFVLKVFPQIHVSLKCSRSRSRVRWSIGECNEVSRTTSRFPDEDEINGPRNFGIFAMHSLHVTASPRIFYRTHSPWNI